MFYRKKRTGKRFNRIKSTSMNTPKDFLTKITNYVNITSVKRWKVILNTKQFTSQSVVQTLIYLFTSDIIRVFLEFCLTGRQSSSLISVYPLGLKTTAHRCFII